ncbi:MAG: extracellular solute-binding protein [Lachnospiraceae bacterium]|nr:extracellular solute-binding protein [Lachnospiraceae bacterium]
MKKIICVILCISMVAASLIGCSSNVKEEEKTISETSADKNEEEISSENTEADTEAEVENQNVEIVMFINSPEYRYAIDQLIEEYKKVEPNVTIKYETIQSDYPTQLINRMNAGEVPDIFSTTAGKETDMFREWSYNLEEEPLAKAMLPYVAFDMKSGGGIYGFPLKGNYFGIVYNKDVLESSGVTEFPSTIKEMKDACRKIKASGYTPFTTGYKEWWVYKHIWQHYFDVAAKNSPCGDPAALVHKFEIGEANIKDYKELYNNYFDFIDLTKENADLSPIDTTLMDQIKTFSEGETAFVVGQGAWIEADCLAQNPNLKIGFNGYPVTNDPEECQVIAGSDSALHVYNDSEHLQETLDFVNWWYTSDYGINWFTNVAKVVPPIATVSESNLEIIKQGEELVQTKGSAELSITYSTDSWHEEFGTLMKKYVNGASKDEICTLIENEWAEIDGEE